MLLLIPFTAVTPVPLQLAFPESPSESSYGSLRVSSDTSLSTEKRWECVTCHITKVMCDIFEVHFLTSPSSFPNQENVSHFHPWIPLVSNTYFYPAFQHIQLSFIWFYVHLSCVNSGLIYFLLHVCIKGFMSVGTH